MACPFVLRNSSLEALDYDRDFPDEISITAYLQVTDEGKVCQLSELFCTLTELVTFIFILLLLHEQWCYDAQLCTRK